MASRVPTTASDRTLKILHEPALPAEADTLDGQLHNLHCAIDIESFWRANRRLLQHAMPHHSCSLMLNIVDQQPQVARHHVVSDLHADYRPASSLTVAGDFLQRHRRIKLYTYSQVVNEDPAAKRRRVEQEQTLLGNWTEFVHLAFWDGNRPDAVLSVRRQGNFTDQELALLERLHPIVDAALYRLRALEAERGRQSRFEHFVTGLPIPILFLDDDLRLSFATTEGYEAVALWNLGERGARAVNPRRAYRLPPEIAAACVRLQKARLTSPQEMVAGERVPHPHHENIVARVALSQPTKGPWARPGFLVTLTMERNLDGSQLTSERTSLRYLQTLSPSGASPCA